MSFFEGSPTRYLVSLRSLDRIFEQLFLSWCRSLHARLDHASTSAGTSTYIVSAVPFWTLTEQQTNAANIHISSFMLFFNIFKYIVEDAESADILYSYKDEHDQYKGE